MITLLEQIQKYHQKFPTEIAPATCLAFAKSQSQCFDRHCFKDGHFTASAWVVNPSRKLCLLTHHRKISKWLQLGGHVENSRDLLAEAQREVKEESGLDSSPLSLDIFDIDIHQVPANRDEPAHLHYDLRFLLSADEKHPLQRTSESHELRWIHTDDIETFTQEESVLRMVKKHLEYSFGSSRTKMDSTDNP
ncbi:MAG: NUDIX hydrolase [Gammaproteobacteria bacterium]|nr:NUDIX hydrolase [Gammaproteobacteria bacterium]